MKGLHVLELAEVEIAVMIIINVELRIVQHKAPVHTDNEESQIIAQTNARANGYILEEP